jgi:hypothetical protein
MGLFGNVLGKLAGPLGIAAIAGKLSELANSVSQFFDNVKTKADEAVEHTRGLRREFDDLFEAMDAFDEKGRRAVTETALTQLQKTGTPREIGLPIIKAYAQQFKALVDAGQLRQEEYERGLQEMLSYGAMHGKAATPDLIAMMSGWGMKTPDQQGAFRRQIAAAAQSARVEDEDVIAALTKGGPAIRAMGWTPGYAVEMIATIAAGETGKTLKTLPATTLQAIMSPQAAKAPEYGLEEKLFEQPEQLLAKLAEMKAAGPIKRLKAGLKKGAPPEYEEVEFRTMLMDIYGAEAGAGAYKIFAERDLNRAALIQRAATEAGAAAEQREREQYQTTQEFQQARTEAKAGRISQRIKSDAAYMRDVRRIGEEKLKQLRTEEPIWQWLRTQYFGTNEEAKKEYAAYREWESQLTEQEKQKTVEEYEGPGRYFVLPIAKRRAALVQRWKEMSAQQKFEALTMIPEARKKQVIPPTPGAGSPATESAPAITGPVATEGPPTSQYFDNRIINYEIHNPVSGMNKQDLGIEPPRLA